MVTHTSGSSVLYLIAFILHLTSRKASVDYESVNAVKYNISIPGGLVSLTYTSTAHLPLYQRELVHLSDAVNLRELPLPFMERCAMQLPF